MAVSEDFRLGDRLIRPVECRIGNGAGELSVDRMAMRVLVVLVDRAPMSVSRDELLDVVWEGRAVTDEVVTAAISRLRRALGDRAAAPRFIETLPGVGYRLVADVLPACRDAGVRSGARRAFRAVGSAWRRLAPPVQFGTASLVGVAAYLVVVCLLLA